MVLLADNVGRPCGTGDPGSGEQTTHEPVDRRPIVPTRKVNDGRSEEEDIEVEDPEPTGERLEAQRAGTQPVPALRQRQDAAHRVPVVWLVSRPRRRRRRLIC